MKWPIYIGKVFARAAVGRVDNRRRSGSPRLYDVHITRALQIHPVWPLVLRWGWHGATRIINAFSPRSRWLVYRWGSAVYRDVACCRAADLLRPCCLLNATLMGPTWRSARDSFIYAPGD